MTKAIGELRIPDLDLFAVNWTGVLDRMPPMHEVAKVVPDVECKAKGRSYIWRTGVGKRQLVFLNQFCPRNRQRRIYFSTCYFTFADARRFRQTMSDFQAAIREKFGVFPTVSIGSSNIAAYFNIGYPIDLLSFIEDHRNDVEVDHDLADEDNYTDVSLDLQISATRNVTIRYDSRDNTYSVDFARTKEEVVNAYTRMKKIFERYKL